MCLICSIDGYELVDIALQQLQAGKLSEEERLMLMHALIGDDPSLPSPNKVGNLDTEESMAYFGQDLDGGVMTMTIGVDFSQSISNASHMEQNRINLIWLDKSQIRRKLWT